MTQDEWRVTGALSARLSARDGTAELYLSGEFDLEGAPAVEQQLSSAVAAHSRLIVDLSALTFMDSSAIGVLARAKRACEAREAKLVVRIGHSPVRRVLDLAGMNEFLGVTD